MMIYANRIRLKLSSLFKVSHFEILLLVFSFALLSSCSDFLVGKPKAQEAFEIQSGLSDCLNDVPTDLKSFLDSKAGGEVLDKTVVCVEETLTKLQEKVEGRQDANSFTVDDVYDIFKTFVKEAQISRETAKNLILLKAALLGGDKTRITKVEINDLKTYLRLIRDEAKKLTPYIQLLSFQKTDKLYSKQFIKEAFTQVNSTIKNLINASKLANSNYSFTDFKNFLINVLDLQGKEKNMVEILTKVNFVLNGYGDIITDSDRALYVDSLTEFLRLYAIQTNGYANFEFENLNELDNTIDFVNEGLSLLENSLQFRRSSLISVTSLDHLMLAISGSDFLPQKVRASSLINFYKTIFVRLFEHGLKGNIRHFTGIKPVNISNLKREIAVYQIYSRLLRKSISNEASGLGYASFDLSELQRVIGSLDIWAEADILNRFDENNQSIIFRIVEEMRSEFLSSHPLVYNQNRLGVANNQNSWKQSLNDLSKGLAVKMLSRLLMLGYGANYQVMNLAGNHITESGLYAWYGEFKALLIDLKSIDPRTANAGSAFFKVANLFTHDGNGDTKMNFKELHENLSILLSGGPIFDAIYADLNTAKCLLPELDVFDNHWSLESCYEKVLDANYRNYFSSLPHMIGYLDRLSSDARKAYFRKIVNVSRVSPLTEGQQVESSDVKGMVSILYYIEELYVVNDSDRNAKFNEAEIRAAYPKFKSVATEFAETTAKKRIDQFTSWMGDVGGFGCFSRDDLIRESFIFLTYNGRLPEFADFHTLPCYRGKPLLTFHGEIDRSQAAAVFQSLREVLAP
jgi:hypothetical protein